MARRTRRLWTDEEKRSICLQTTAPGVSVAQVALRYTVNANLIFKWLRDPKYRPKPGAGSEEAVLRFLPVEIVAEARAPAAAPVPDSCIVNRIVRPRLTCACCEKFVQSPLPSRPIERGRPGPGLLAHVLVSKYADHLPLYRQSQISDR